MKDKKVKKNEFIIFNSKELELLKGCMSTEDTKYLLCGIYLSKDGKSVVSTDGRKLMKLHKEFNKEFGDKIIRMNFPFRKSDVAILDFHNNIWRVGIGLIINKEYEVGSSRSKPISYYDIEELEGQFPDLEDIFPKKRARAIIRINTKHIPKEIDGTFNIHDNTEPVEIDIQQSISDPRRVDATCLVMPMKPRGEI
jgi:hypothetical protein